jgi:hypothetical protein
MKRNYRRRYMRYVTVALTSALVIAPIDTSRATCSDATQLYNLAISDISDALRRYTRCLSNSSGQDDCSSEFRRLLNAQSDFESAVSQFGLECR